MTTLSNLFTQIRNAINSKHYTVKIIDTKMASSILFILKEEGFIVNYKKIQENNKKFLIIILKYHKTQIKNSNIHKIKTVSKPSSRMYIRSKKIPKVLNNLGIAILSTSKGILTNLKAKKLGIGGEILCYIW